MPPTQRNTDVIAPPQPDNVPPVLAQESQLPPANANVMGALLKVKKNDIVKIDGYLVDIYNGKGKTLGKSSLSRTDTDATSRGYGACEEMYAKQVQIGNKIYK